jgi:hypothetical protein
VAALANQIDNGPVSLPGLEMIGSERGQFGAP